MTHTAKLFTNGRSQAVRLPAAFRFDTKEVFIRQNPQTGRKTHGLAAAVGKEFCGVSHERSDGIYQSLSGISIYIKVYAVGSLTYISARRTRAAPPAPRVAWRTRRRLTRRWSAARAHRSADDRRPPSTHARLIAARRCGLGGGYLARLSALPSLDTRCKLPGLAFTQRAATSSRRADHKELAPDRWPGRRSGCSFRVRPARGFRPPGPVGSCSVRVSSGRRQPIPS